MDQQKYVYFYSVTARSTGNSIAETSGMLTIMGDFSPGELLDGVEKAARENIGDAITVKSMVINDIHSVEGPWSS